MKEVYLVSFLRFREKEKQVATYAYAFSKSEEAFKFMATLFDSQCSTMSVHEVYETYEDALVKMCESVANQITGPGEAVQ